MSHPTIIRRDVRVFISAVTKELGTVRTLVEAGLKANDYHAIEQNNFALSYRDLREKLRERISTCDAVVHIAGHCFGAEPYERPNGVARRSYTQLEYDLAKELGKPVYVFLTGESFPTDPHDAEPGDLRELQEAHRRSLTSSGQDYFRATTRESLDLQIRGLHLKVERLEKELTQVDQHVVRTGQSLGRGIVGAIVVGVIILAVVLFVQNEQRSERDRQESSRIVQQQEHDRQEVERQRQDAERKHQAQERKKQEAERLASEKARETAKKIDSELLRQEIRAAASKQINELPDEKGRWEKVTKIERQRDLQLARVDELVQYINTTLQAGASEVFQRALEIQADRKNGGIDEALAYLESKREQTFSTARRQAEELRATRLEVTAREDKLKETLKAVTLEAELLEVNLQWRQSLELRQEIAGLTPNSSEARRSLGELQLKLGQFDEAESQICAAIKLTTDPQEEAMALNELGELLQATNRAAAAELVLRRAMVLDEKYSGSDHVVTTIRLINMAGLLQTTSRLSEAEPLLRRALDNLERHPANKISIYTTTLNNLGMLLLDENHGAEAELLLRRALAIDEQTYGTEYPDVARDLNNLATLLTYTSRPEMAEPVSHRVLMIFSKSLGESHPDTATALSNLAHILAITNKRTIAEPLFRRSLEIAEQVYGPEHPNIAMPLNNLGRLLQDTNRPTAAEPLMLRVIAILHRFQQKSDHPHPEIEAAKLNFRELLVALKVPADQIEPRLQSALETPGILQPIVPDVERLLGPARPVADALASLDLEYQAEGKPPIYFLKPEQPITPHLDELLTPTGASWNAAGLKAYLRKSYADAVVLYDEALKVFATDPQQSATALITRMNRAAAMRELGDVEAAREELRRLIPEIAKSIVPNVVMKGRSRYHLALCEWRLGHRDAALDLVEESLTAYGIDPNSVALKLQSEQLRTNLKEDQPLAPLPQLAPAAELAKARVRLQVNTESTAALASDLRQPAAPLLDKLLGPAKSMEEVLKMLDEKHREQGKSRLWSLPLSESIAPYLDELLKPVPVEQ